MKPKKKPFRKLSILFVTLWARIAYNKGVAAADLRHANEGSTIYLIEDTFKRGRLVTYDKAQFKAEKHVYGMSARLLTMNTLRQGAYYYTADRFGRSGLSHHEKEIRRKAFVRDRLRLAKLI